MFHVGHLQQDGLRGPAHRDGEVLAVIQTLLTIKTFIKLFLNIQNTKEQLRKFHEVKQHVL